MRRKSDKRQQSNRKQITLAAAALLAAAMLAGCGSDGNKAEVSPAQEQTAEAVVPKQENAQTEEGTAQTGEGTAQTAGTSGTAAVNTGSAAQTKENVIAEADAKKIALDHAQVKEADAVFVKVKMERDDGMTKYEVEFYLENKEYDYEINALTGEILSYDYDIESKVPAVTAAQPDNGTAAFSLEDAKKLALSKVTGADDTHIKIKEELDDGIRKYEGKIVYGEMEYDFEIDAATGTMLEWEAESIYD